MKIRPFWLRWIILSGVLLVIMAGAIFWILNSQGPLATIVSIVFVALGLVFSFLQIFPLSKSDHRHDPGASPQQIVIHLPSPSTSQKVVVDVPHVSSERHSESTEETRPAPHRENWGEAPHIGRFYGRAEELTQLSRWVLSNSCRVIAVLGMGGLGKTTIVTKLAEQIKVSFTYVFWRSLRKTLLLQKCSSPPACDFLRLTSLRRYRTRSMSN